VDLLHEASGIDAPAVFFHAPSRTGIIYTV